MKIPNGAMVAVVDGEKLSLFHNDGNEANPKLSATDLGSVDASNKSGGAGHASSSANPDESTQDEDGFVTGVVELLNKQAVSGKVKALIVVAAPKALGETRKHYHAKLKDALIGEIAKDLTGQTAEEIQKSIASN